MLSGQSTLVVGRRVEKGNSGDHLSGSAKESLYFVLANVAGHFSTSHPHKDLADGVVQGLRTASLMLTIWSVMEHLSLIMNTWESV